MNDTILTILVIGGIFVGLPLFIMWLNDRGGVAGLIVKKIFGCISLVFGLIIIGWVIYNLFRPTKEFKASFLTIFQLALPLAMVGMGWHWLTRKVNDSNADESDKE